MLNKTALSAAARSIWRKDMAGWGEKAQAAAWEDCSNEPGGYIEQASAAIEAYHAALLGDEDGLVKTLRDQATIADERRRGGMAVLLGKAADALEAARVAAPEISDDR